MFTEALYIHEACVTLWLVTNLGPPFVAEPLVERRRLEAVCRQDNLFAASPPGFRFGRPQQRLADSAPAPVPVYPQMRDHTAAAPRVAVERGDDFAHLVAEAAAQELSIEIARRLRISLVEPLDQHGRKRFAFAFVADLKRGCTHGTYPKPSRPRLTRRKEIAYRTPAR